MDRGRRPELKSDEFLRWIAIVVEIISILVEIVRRLCVHLLGFGVKWRREYACYPLAATALNINKYDFFSTRFRAFGGPGLSGSVLLAYR